MIIGDTEGVVEEFVVWVYLQGHIRVNQAIKFVSLQGTITAEIEKLEVAWEVSFLFSQAQLNEIKLISSDFFGGNANGF